MADETMLEKIYQKYKSLKIDAKNDCTLDKTNLNEAFTVTNCLIKWITIKTEWSRVYRDFEEKRKKQYRASYEFYHTDFPMKLDTKEQYNIFIESDPAYVTLLHECLTIKEILQFVDSVLDTLKNKQWEIKAFIEYQKFINGGK
jgi:hypothetical protein